MKLLIIGATGGTGQELVKQALEHGHIVTVLVRTPGKIKIVHDSLCVVKGDVLNYESVAKAVVGQEAVLSALGHKKFFVRTSILSRGTENIMRAMNEQKVMRFICITSLGINDSRFKLGLYYTLFVIPFIVFFYFRDKAKQERLIRESNLMWTIVRPGQMTNGKKRGTYKHGSNVGSYIFTRMISRADVANFILTELSENRYLYKAPGIAY